MPITTQPELLIMPNPVSRSGAEEGVILGGVMGLDQLLRVIFLFQDFLLLAPASLISHDRPWI